MSYFLENLEKPEKKTLRDKYSVIAVVVSVAIRCSNKNRKQSDTNDDIPWVTIAPKKSTQERK